MFVIFLEEEQKKKSLFFKKPIRITYIDVAPIPKTKQYVSNTIKADESA